MTIVKDVRNAVRLEDGAIDCEVLFSHYDDYVLYTAIEDDETELGSAVWEALKAIEIPPFVATPEMLQEAKDSKQKEINQWRLSQETQNYTVVWNERTWNAGPESLARIIPVALASEQIGVETVTWSDVANETVTLTIAELKGLVSAMAEEQVKRNEVIFQKQRALKEQLATLTDLKSVREFVIQ